MNNWWDTLDVMHKVLYCIAIPSAFILILQTIFSLAGFGHKGDINISDTSGIDTDFDVSTDTDIDFNHDMNLYHDSVVPDFDILKLFTIQGILAFFTVFSWMSIALMSLGVPYAGSLIIGILSGIGAMYGVAWLIFSMKKLTENGTVDFRNAIGENAVVYIPIPPSEQGEGKVTVNFQGRYMECDAVTTHDYTLKTGLSVRVTDLRGNILVVEQDD